MDDSSAPIAGAPVSPLAAQYQAYLDADQHIPPAHLRELGDADPGFEDVPVEHYISRDFYERERRMWDKVWQIACRVEHIPNVGDYQVYDICERSYLVVRSGLDEIKAYPNACLHRGRRLRSENGSVDNFRCPFHGFTWRLDGSLQFVPSAEEFPQIRPSEFCLPTVRVGVWAGWVFINPDPNAPDLVDYLDPIAHHYEPYLWERSYLASHVGKVLKGNWKVVQEAFMESYHALVTHPQIQSTVDDLGCQYDQWAGKPHVNRMMAAFVVPRVPMAGEVSEQQVFDDWMGVRPTDADSTDYYTLAPGETARHAVANRNRKAAEAAIGQSLAEASDVELVDGWYYNVFPNLMLWGGYGPSMWYRFRPWGDDHESTLMEVGFIARHRPDEPRPAPARYTFLEEDQLWAEAREIGNLGPVLDQDTTNMAEIQKGLKATFRSGVVLAGYQESRIRHFHQTLKTYVG